MLKKIIFNKYFLILVAFGIWMIFFDDNSVKIHRQLNKDIQKLQNSIDFYENEIEKDKKMLEDYEHPDALEKYARENYQMKKDSEDIYIIETDSID